MPYSAQLAAIRGQIADAEMELEEKKEELRRLQDALSELGANKSDFISKEGICLEPEFSLKTFHGENADDFDDFREGELKVSFLAIPNEQITDAEGKISDKIAEVEAEIEALESRIASLEATYARLLASQASASRASGVSK